jgi:ABC-type lipoprotein export system ATPase subunit
MKAPVLSMRGVEKVYVTPGEALTALADFDFDVAAGELVVILGPSACGKSTLVRVAAGIEDVTSGQVFVNDIDIDLGLLNAEQRARVRRRHIGVVFHRCPCWPGDLGAVS